MIRGIGLDLIELDRVKQAMSVRFLERVLTEAERKQCKQLTGRRQLEYVAGRFCAKEALAKANGTGIGELSFQDMEVLVGDKGEPIMTCSKIQERIHVSITHTKTTVAAQVILEETDERSKL